MFVQRLWRPKATHIKVHNTEPQAGAESRPESRTGSRARSRAQRWRLGSDWRPEWGPESVPDKAGSRLQRYRAVTPDGLVK